MNRLKMKIDEIEVETFQISREQEEALVRGADARLRAQPRLTGTLYLATAGDDDIDDAGKALAAALRAAAPKGLTWYYEPRPDLRHSTIYRGASPGVFRKLFPPVKKTAP